MALSACASERFEYGDPPGALASTAQPAQTVPAVAGGSPPGASGTAGSSVSHAQVSLNPGTTELPTQPPDAGGLGTATSSDAVSSGEGASEDEATSGPDAGEPLRSEMDGGEAEGTTDVEMSPEPHLSCERDSDCAACVYPPSGTTDALESCVCRGCPAHAANRRSCRERTEAAKPCLSRLACPHQRCGEEPTVRCIEGRCELDDAQPVD